MQPHAGCTVGDHADNEVTTMSKLETARIAVTLTGAQWASLCVNFVLGKSLTEDREEVCNHAKADIMRQVLRATKAGNLS